MPRYIHPHSLVPWEWFYRATIYPPPLSSSRGEVVIPWHCILIPHNIWRGGDYIMTLYFHSWQHLVRGWLHHNIIFSVLTIFGGGDYIMTLYFHSWQYLVRGDYIMTLYFHSWQYLVKGWLYHDLIFTLDNIWWGGDYIFVTLYFHCWQYLVRVDYIMTLYFHSWQCLVRGWLYRDIFTPDNIGWGGDYIVTLYFHSWRSPRIWHWRWLYFDIFPIQIWLCSDTRVFLFIHIYSPHETWG